MEIASKLAWRAVKVVFWGLVLVWLVLGTILVMLLPSRVRGH